MITPPGLKIGKFERALVVEWFVTAPLSARSECHRLLQAAGAAVVAEEVLGQPRAPAECLEWPVTRLCVNPKLTGVHIHAVEGPAVHRIKQNGRVIGSVFEDGVARHCRLGGLGPEAVQETPAEQAAATFALLEAALREAGMTFANVGRTWFYLDHILTWYREFNQVRDQFFQTRKVFAGLVPASTGIGSANCAGTALVAGAYAVAGGELQAVPSPLQCPALQYGSSFSRAVELTTPDHQRLWVSGTASIAPAGQTVHVGDVAGQIELTMQVVAAILESRGLGWADVNRAIAYVRAAATAQQFQAYRTAHGLVDWPVVITENVICRDDLLFEVEVDAGCVTAAKSQSVSPGRTPAE